MNRKKSKRKTGSLGRQDKKSATEPADRSATTNHTSLSPLPSRAVRALLSLWLCIHLPAILISFTSVVEPSEIHARLSESVNPYLRPAHFSADDRPVYLAHGDSSEQPHQIQVTRQTVTDIVAADAEKWTTVGPDRYPGLAVSDRVSRWLSTAAMLSENDQPGLVAELLLPLAHRDSDVMAIRIVRLPTDLSDVDAEAESTYVASVIRTDDRVSLVQLNPARLSSQVVTTRERSGDE